MIGITDPATAVLVAVASHRVPSIARGMESPLRRKLLIVQVCTTSPLTRVPACPTRKSAAESSASAAGAQAKLPAASTAASAIFIVLPLNPATTGQSRSELQ